MLPVKNKYKYRNDSSKSLDIIKQNGEKSGQQRQRRHRLGRKPVFDKPEILIAEAVLVIILLLFLAETLFLAIAAYLLCKYFTFIFESQRNNIDKLKKFGGLQEKTGQHRVGKRVTCQKFMAKKPIDLNFYDKQEFLNAWDYTVNNKMRKNYPFYLHVPVFNKYEVQDKMKKQSENVDESERNHEKDPTNGTKECQSSENKSKNFGNEKNCQDETKRGIGDDNDDHSGKDDDDNDDHSQDDDYADKDDHGGDDDSHGDHDDHGNEDNHDDDDHDNSGNDDQDDQDNCDGDDDDLGDQDDQGNQDDSDGEDDSDDSDEDVDNQYKILVHFDEEKLGISYNSNQPCYNKNYEYVKLKLVGQGSFGKCYKIKDLKKKKIYAMKVITRTKDGSEELSVMKDLMDSPNILDIYGAVEDQKLIRIFMPLAQGGTLLSFLQDFQQRTGRKGLDRNLQRHFLQGIMSGLKFMHSKGYIHRDIKSENILMFCEHGGGEWRAVISDFGFAIHVSHQSLKGALYGTAQFASPEAVKCEQLSYATDIWSSGCVLIEMDSGDPPWKYQAKFGLGAILYAIGIASEPPIPDDCTSDMMAKLYQGMLAINPNERFTASEILDILDEIH